MPQNVDLELISFELCPFVQRARIALLHKGAPHRMTFIDLEHPPAWFDEISPLGQVPVLRVNGQTAVFESSVINEYLDETVGVPLHSRDPLRRAFERAWIEFGSSLLEAQYGVLSETDPAVREEKIAEYFVDLARVEGAASAEGPFFRGPEFSLVDAAYAPLFMRQPLTPAGAPSLSPSLSEDPRFQALPRLRRWSAALLALPEVQQSVVPGFEAKFRAAFGR